MKRLTTIALALLLALAASARPVDVVKAQQVAIGLFGQVVNKTPAHWTEMYLFEPAEGEGFVLVAADDCAHPVLAYSTANGFGSVDEMPAHVAFWIEGYRNYLRAAREAESVPTPQVAAEWNTLSSIVLAPQVGPLLTTQWNQSPYYNSMCPLDPVTKQRSVSGCVATAMTQIMKYWNHPAKGHGEHGYTLEGVGPIGVTFDTLYDWSNMPDKLSWSSNSTQVHAVAQLTYHVGVAVEMSYSSSSSGAFTHDYGTGIMSADKAFPRFFRYNPMIKSILRNKYSDAEWDSLLRHELTYGRPVLYSGRDDEGGHAFVFDGYDVQSRFHVNWGWGGWYDGYYMVDSLAPGASGIGGNSSNSYTQANAAIVQIFPAYGNDTVAIAKAVSCDTTMGYIVGNGDYVAYEDTLCVSAVPQVGYRFDGWKSGFVDNPYRYVPNGDLDDTALFVPAGRDTLSYCDDVPRTGWRALGGSATEWAIRIPAEWRNEKRSLTGIQAYTVRNGYYNIGVYVADSLDGATPLLSVQKRLPDENAWNEVIFDEPIPIVGDKPVWITLRFSAATFDPAVSSLYTGIPDASWLKRYGSWVCAAEQGEYYTWMVRALFDERDYVVQVEPGPYMYNEPVSGDGLYPEGAVATLQSTSDAFRYWEMGGQQIHDNPYSFTVTQDTVVLAVGSNVGIDDVQTDAFSVRVVGHEVWTSEHVDLVDMLGRSLDEGTRLRVPAAGVYLLRSRSGKVVKVVIN